MRCFIALELCEGFVNDLRLMAQQLKRTVPGKYVSPENYHITMAFLGDIDEGESRLVIDAMEEACEVLKSDLDDDEGFFNGVIPFESDGLGKFGRRNNATLWLGIGACGDLISVAEALRSSLSERGIWFDDKSFLPHITFARHADLRDCEIETLLFPNPSFSSRITFYKSTLTKEGAIYKPLYTIDTSDLLLKWLKG